MVEPREAPKRVFLPLILASECTSKDGGVDVEYIRADLAAAEAVVVVAAREPMPGAHIRLDGKWCHYLHNGTHCNKCGFTKNAEPARYTLPDVAAILEAEAERIHADRTRTLNRHTEAMGLENAARFLRSHTTGEK